MHRVTSGKNGTQFADWPVQMSATFAFLAYSSGHGLEAAIPDRYSGDRTGKLQWRGDSRLREYRR
jgi:hypothetical protein